MTCKNCGYISTEKVPESKAKEMVHSHLGGPQELYQRAYKTCESQSLGTCAAALRYS